MVVSFSYMFLFNVNAKIVPNSLRLLVNKQKMQRDFTTAPHFYCKK